MDTSREARIADVMQRLRWDMPGAGIEQESFRTIEREFPDVMAAFPGDQWIIARRLIHTTADPSIAKDLAFACDPIESGIAALRRGAPIFCDSGMIRAGLSVAKLSRLHASYTRESLHCYIADRDVAERARREGRTRAICAAEKARPLLDGGIVLIGNAPLALARVARFCLEENVKPALVIGMPVGFVNVTESKELLELCPVPQIVLRGRRGGSPLAVACLHAVIECAFARGAGA